MRRRAAAAILTALGTLVLVESAARLAPEPWPGWELELRKQRVYSIFEEDPELGAVPSAPRVARYRWGGREVEVRHIPFQDGGRQGHRAGPGQLRPEVLLLGDSYAYALEQPWELGIAGRLERLSGLGIANFGVPGHGTRQQAMLLERFGLVRNPRLVLLLSTPNDARESLLFESWERSRRTGAAEQRSASQFALCAGASLGPRACRWTQAALRSDSLLLKLAARRFVFWKAQRALRFDDPRALDAMESSLRRIRAACRSRGIPFILVWSDGWRLYPRALERLRAWASDSGVPDLELGVDGLFPRVPLDRHWTADGHERAAREVFSFVDARGLWGPRETAAAPAGR